jgi:hypothetical protein
MRKVLKLQIPHTVIVNYILLYFACRKRLEVKSIYSNEVYILTHVPVLLCIKTVFEKTRAGGRSQQVHNFSVIFETTFIF